MKRSMADYLVSLFLKYFFRALIVLLLLLLFFEVVMQLEGLHKEAPLEFHVIDMVEGILSPADVDGPGVNLVPAMTSAALETSKVWFLTILLSIGFGVPLGIIFGRIGCAGRYGSLGWRTTRATGRLVLTPCMILVGLPAFGLAALIVFYMIEVIGVPVFELMGKGGQGFCSDDARVIRWWRLLLPAAVVSVSGAAWLASEVAQILWMTNEAGFVRTAVDNGVSKGRIFFYYTVKNSMCRIGSVILRSLPNLLGALILVEWVFRFPGLGAMIRIAAGEDDFVRLLAAGFLFASMVMVTGFFLETIFGFIDENTRQGGVLNQESMGNEGRQPILQQLENHSVLETEEGKRKVKRMGQYQRSERASSRRMRAKRMSRLKWAWVIVMGVCGALWGIHMLGVLGGGLLGQVELIEVEWRRVLIGAGGTLVMAIIASLLAVFISFFLATMPGCLGGRKVYCLIAETHTAISSVPALFWCFVGLMLVGGGFGSVVLVLACVGGILGVGVVSQWILDMESQGWIEAAKATGLKRRQIFFKHFVPSIWPRIISRTLLLLPPMLLYVVAADFSGLVETEGDLNRWGILLAEGKIKMLDDPDLLIFSVSAVCLLAVSLAAVSNWAKFDNRDRPGLDIY